MQRPDVYHMVPLLVMVLVLVPSTWSLDNGVALTPPMGWLDWERFECNTECDTDPDNCISEHLFMQMADMMVKDGYRDAGYEYVCIDDCWLAKHRDSQGHLQADPIRFPSGMKALADYMHTRGLKLGVYGDVGTMTCAGFPGSQGHIEEDAQTFADWGVDLLKFDGCHADVPQFDYGFPAMTKALNATGRHIVYSCEWPMYAKAHGAKPDYQLISQTCNMFRELTDIYDDWGSVIGMIEYFGDDPGNFSAVAGPGSWNDPDQMVIGNFGLSHDQERVQMALYAILASPMLMSNDLRKISPESKAILLNKGVIAISQDPLGIQGKRVKEVGTISLWTRPVMPQGSLAVAFLNVINQGFPLKASMNLTEVGLTNQNGYNITEVFGNVHLGVFKPTDIFTCKVNPSGVYLIKATPLNQEYYKFTLNMKPIHNLLHKLKHRELNDAGHK